MNELSVNFVLLQSKISYCYICKEYRIVASKLGSVNTREVRLQHQQSLTMPDSC